MKKNFPNNSLCWYNNEYVKFSYMYISIIFIIVYSFFIFIYLLLNDVVFLIISSTVILITIPIAIYFLKNKLPKKIGISNKGVHIKMITNSKPKKVVFENGSFGTKIKEENINSFIPWNQIESIKIIDENKFWTKSCWIILKDGSKIPLNFLTSNIINRIVLSWKKRE